MVLLVSLVSLVSLEPRCFCFLLSKLCRRLERVFTSVDLDNRFREQGTDEDRLRHYWETICSTAPVERGIIEQLTFNER